MVKTATMKQTDGYEKKKWFDYDHKKRNKTELGNIRATWQRFNLCPTAFFCFSSYKSATFGLAQYTSQHFAKSKESLFANTLRKKEIYV